MKLKDCVIAWEPKPGGRCMVLQLGAHVPNGWSTTGGCWEWVATAAKHKRIQFVTAEALAMIVRDGLNGMDVHKALMMVDEYVLACADDMPGIAKLKARMDDANDEDA